MCPKYIGGDVSVHAPTRLLSVSYPLHENRDARVHPPTTILIAYGPPSPFPPVNQILSHRPEPGALLSTLDDDEKTLSYFCVGDGSEVGLFSVRFRGVGLWLWGQRARTCLSSFSHERYPRG